MLRRLANPLNINGLLQAAQRSVFAGPRRKLHFAMHISDHPSPEVYAQISPRYDSRRPMQLEDGRCALHAELGDGVQAAVCRLYPRGVRTGEVYECSCANSCEAVIALLLGRQEKIRFIPLPMAFV